MPQRLGRAIGELLRMPKTIDLGHVSVQQADVSRTQLAVHTKLPPAKPMLSQVRAPNSEPSHSSPSSRTPLPQPAMSQRSVS